MITAPDTRLPAIRVRDVIIAALQAAFSQQHLVGDDAENPYLFIAQDPAGSRVWISSEEGRLASGRDGRRNCITVVRTEYVPSENHLHNLAGASPSSGVRQFTDLGTCTIGIHCEAGNERESESLASICYMIIKLFRHQIMEDYDIFNLRLGGVSAASKVEAVPGQPWRTSVSLQIQIQEHAEMTPIANTLNHLDIAAHLPVATLDATIA